MSDRHLMGLVQEIYSVGLNSQFLFNKLIGARDLDDLRYFGRAGRKVIGHMLDYKKGLML